MIYGNGPGGPPAITVPGEAGEGPRARRRASSRARCRPPGRRAPAAQVRWLRTGQVELGPRPRSGRVAVGVPEATRRPSVAVVAVHLGRRRGRAAAILDDRGAWPGQDSWSGRRRRCRSSPPSSRCRRTGRRPSPSTPSARERRPARRPPGPSPDRGRDDRRVGGEQLVRRVLELEHVHHHARGQRPGELRAQLDLRAEPRHERSASARINGSGPRTALRSAPGARRAPRPRSRACCGRRSARSRSAGRRPCSGLGSAGPRAPRPGSRTILIRAASTASAAARGRGALGSHQLRAPIRCITAGTRIVRRMNASSRTAIARPIAELGDHPLARRAGRIRRRRS